MRKWFLSLVALGLCGCGSDTGANLTSAAESFQLNVLHYNDSNSALVSSDDFGGVARFATVLKREQGRRPSLTLAGGNHLGAGAQFQASRERGVPFFEAVALQEMGVQASAVGPGEFYYGPANFAQFLRGVTLPFVSANLDYSAQPELVGNPRRTTLRLLGREVCVVGVSTPRLAFTSTPGDVVVRDQLAALTQAEIDQAEQNVVIVLANLDNLQAARALARQLRGVDLMVASSRSEILANAGQTLVPGDVASAAYPVLEQGLDGHPVPIVLTGGDFHYVGRVGVMLDAQGDYQGLAGDSGPLRVAGGAQPDAVVPDPTLARDVELPLSQALAQLATQIVGFTQVPLDGVDADLVTMETNLGDFLADSLLSEGRRLAPAFHATAPTVALLNGGAVNSHVVLPVGNLTRLDFNQMLPFASFLVVVPAVPPGQLKELLENAVSRVSQQEGRFCQVAGLSFSWDPAGTAQQVDDQGTVLVPGTRVRTVTLAGNIPLVVGGQVVPGAPAVSVATLDFLARGGDQAPFRGRAFTALGQDYEQTARQFLTLALHGQILSASYPAAGLGRITRL